VPVNVAAKPVVVEQCMRHFEAKLFGNPDFCHGVNFWSSKLGKKF
jgi:hypothetical protein